MVTAIVRKVQAMLQASGRHDVAVDIVFPVASEAITTDSSSHPGPTQTGNGNGATLPGGLPVVPGPAGGEGCSAEGGCASCPYMKVKAHPGVSESCCSGQCSHASLPTRCRSYVLLADACARQGCSHAASCLADSIYMAPPLRLIGLHAFQEVIT